MTDSDEVEQLADALWRKWNQSANYDPEEDLLAFGRAAAAVGARIALKDAAKEFVNRGGYGDIAMWLERFAEEYTTDEETT